MLRRTVSRSLCLGIKHPFGAYEQVFVTVIQFRVCWWGGVGGAFSLWTQRRRTSHIASERTHREHHLHHLFCCVTSPYTRTLRALHDNGCTRHVSWHLLYCCVGALPSNVWCLHSHLLVTGLYATIWHYCLLPQPSRSIIQNLACQSKLYELSSWTSHVYTKMAYVLISYSRLQALSSTTFPDFLSQSTKWYWAGHIACMETSGMKKRF
jgi:hypothetical protein